jgi:cytochrome c556
VKKYCIACWLAAVLALLVLGSGVVPLQAQEKAAAAESVVETYELMEMLFEPQQLALKGALAQEPEDRKAWKKVFLRANSIAELSNLLFIRSTEDYEQTDEWRQMIVASREAAVAVAGTIRTKDYAAAKQHYGTLIESCNACHQKFVTEDPPVVEP